MWHFFWKICNRVTWCQLTFFKYFVTPRMNFLKFSLGMNFKYIAGIFPRDSKNTCLLQTFLMGEVGRGCVNPKVRNPNQNILTFSMLFSHVIYPWGTKITITPSPHRNICHEGVNNLMKIITQPCRRPFLVCFCPLIWVRDRLEKRGWVYFTQHNFTSQIIGLCHSIA